MRRTFHVLSLAVAAGFLISLLGCGGGHETAVGFETRALACVDLDGDGRLDVVGVNRVWRGGHEEAGFLGLRLADPTHPGAFLPPVRLAVDPGAQALAVADLNGDGAPDLVVASRQPDAQGIYGLQVFLQNPTARGTFQPPTRLAIGPREPRALLAQDLDGDGRVDLAVAAWGGTTLLISTQTAGGTFGAWQALEVGGEPRALVCGDLTGTGAADSARRDLAVATAKGEVVVLKRETSGYAAPASYPVGTRPSGLALADMNGDGSLDLVVALAGSEDTWEAGQVGILSRIPGAGFQPVRTLVAGGDVCLDVAVGDVDGDGRPDLLVACLGYPGDPGLVSVLRQDPATPGSFLAPDRYRGYWGPRVVLWKDADGDGTCDMLVADGDPLMRPGLVTPAGRFGFPIHFLQ